MSLGARPRRAGVRPSRALCAAVLLVVVSACSTTTDGQGSRQDRSSVNASSSASGSAPGASASPSASNSATACPAERAQPDPRRPVVALTFDLSDDHASVMGTEKLDFTPDLDVTELVFRLTANTVPTFAKGNSVTVTAATVDHGGGTPRYETAGAAATSQGGLLRIPFR